MTGLFGPRALDRDARQIRDLLDDVLLLGDGALRLAMVDREGSEHPSFRVEHRCRPAGPQTVRQSHLSVIGPQWIRLDVGDNDRRLAIGSRPA